MFEARRTRFRMIFGRYREREERALMPNFDCYKTLPDNINNVMRLGLLHRKPEIDASSYFYRDQGKYVNAQW